MTSIMSTTGEPDYVPVRPRRHAGAHDAAAHRARRRTSTHSATTGKLFASPRYYDEDQGRATAPAAATTAAFYPEGAARQMGAILASGSRADGLRALRVPTLVIHGRADTLILPDRRRAHGRAGAGGQPAAVQRHGPRPARAAVAAHHRHDRQPRPQRRRRHLRLGLAPRPVRPAAGPSLRSANDRTTDWIPHHRGRRDRPGAVLRHDARRHGGRRRSASTGPRTSAAASTRRSPRPTCSPAAAATSPSTSSSPTASRRCSSWSSRPTPSSRASGPGVMERLGIGPDVCLARNPKLVFGRMTGWGQDGPVRAVERSRHQLHLAVGHAGPHRSGRRGAGAAAEPGRRLRRRRHAARLRRGVRPARDRSARARVRSSTPPWSTAPPSS